MKNKTLVENKIKENEYQCAMCNGIFEKGWTDEEANKEAKDDWGIDNASEDSSMAVVCDDCFNGIKPENHKETAREFGYKK